jgi:uncharacterized protein (TIGR01244 family)
MVRLTILTTGLIAVSLAFGQAPAWAEGAKVAPVAVGQSPNSSAFGSQVYFAGQPSQADFAEYAKLGVKTVVNLRMPAEMEKAGFDEAAVAKAAGMEYVSIPVPGMPADSDLAKIYAELSKAGSGKVLMHCATSNRSGVAWAAFRSTQHKLPAEDALNEGKAAGLKSPVLEKLIREKLGVKP